MWKQRSKDYNIKEGDRNTKYFHMIASRRRRNNFIAGVEDERGIWCDEPQKIENAFLRYFREIFTSTEPTNMAGVYDGITQRLSAKSKIQLDKEFTKKEIHEALFQMNSNKAPRPDGMTACFYQRYWKVIGGDISKVIL